MRYVDLDHQRLSAAQISGELLMELRQPAFGLGLAVAHGSPRGSEKLAVPEPARISLFSRRLAASNDLALRLLFSFAIADCANR